MELSSVCLTGWASRGARGYPSGLGGGGVPVGVAYRFPTACNAGRGFRFQIRRNEMTDEINQHGIRPVAFWLAMSLLLTFGSVALTVALYGVLHR